MTFLEGEDPELAQLRPAIIVGEFSQMLRDAVDLSQDLSHLQRFTLNFADEPHVVIPTPHRELSRRRVLTMSRISGAPFSDRASVEAVGWDVEALVHRAANVHLEMIFRGSLYHADPHPGNLLLPDGSHLALLDLGDVGRISSVRRHQLGRTARRDGDHHHRHGPAARRRPRAAGRPVDALPDPPAVAGARSQRGHRGPDHRVAPAVREEVVGAAVRSAAGRPPHGPGASGLDHLAASLPGDIERVIEQIHAGQFAVDLRVHEADGAVDRLVDGLVASASVLASAQLVSRRTVSRRRWLWRTPRR